MSNSNMPFTSFAKWLNKKSTYLIDWTRVGELLRSGNHKYSFQEIIPRIFIIICTIMPIILHKAFTKTSIFQSFITFVISHGIVILPLILKRNYIKNQCYATIKIIKQKHCDCDCDCEATIPMSDFNSLNNSNDPNKLCKVCTSIKIIMTDVAKNEKSSATWGMRYRNLQAIK